MKKIFILAVIIIVPLCLIYYLNHRYVISRMNELQQETKAIIHADAHFKYYVNPMRMVIDIKYYNSKVTNEEVFDFLMQFAQKMRDRKFAAVILCYKGEEKFIMDGDFFMKLGNEYKEKKKKQTASKLLDKATLDLSFFDTKLLLPDYLKNPDGAPAFPEKKGNISGAAGKTNYDLFHDRWYRNPTPK